MRAEQVVSHAWELFQAGQFEAAARALRQILQRAPGEPNANKLMALIHGAQHQDEQALFFISRAAAASPKDPDLHFMHGNVLFLLRRMEQAVPVLRRCLQLKHDHAMALDVLSKCLLTLGRGDEAASEYSRAIERSPGTGRLYRDLAGTLCEIGRSDDAAAVLTRGLAAVPADRDLAMAAACYLNFVDTDPAVHRDLHVRVAGELPGASTARGAPPLRGDRPPRVALLSSDFRNHACGTFLRPLVRFWPEDLATLHLYSTVTTPDAWTAWFQARPNWRDVAALDAGSLRRRAEADAIDVVVECNGWTDGHRLDALSARVAPFQATFLGYPNTTGVRGIDARLVDSVTDPRGSESHCTERLERIDGCFLCYMPEDGDPEPRLSDALAPGGAAVPITFGSFNRLAKISERTVRLWAGVLRRVPNSRLLLKSRVQSDPLNREFAARFAAQGVDPARIAFSPYAAAHAEHLSLYREIDIALDCTPYNGTTTTCEALWMGVPVVTVAGDVHRARVGASLLAAAGLPELVARGDAEFESIVAGLADDRGSLRRLHEGLRQRVRGSPLFDAAGYARRFVSALVGAWRAGGHA